MCCVRNIVYFICIIILSISCSKNEEEPVKQASSSAAAMSVTAAPGMRMITSNYTKQFGIYASCPNTNNNNKTFDNCKYKIKSYETGELEAVDKAIVFPSNDAETEFWGYYPYMSTAPIYEISDWNNPTNQEILDLLVTKEKAKGKMSSPRVELQFYHAFSKIVLNISADSENSLLQDGELAGLEVKADMMNAMVRYDMLNDKFTEITPLSTPITFKTQSDGSKSEAIICPDYNTDIDRVLTFTLNGKTCTWTIKADTKFEKGTCYIYDLRLKGDDLVEAELIAVFHDWNEEQNGNIILSNKLHGVINGHEWVDLGLRVKWATCNVGANKPEDYGKYYAWGETSAYGEAASAYPADFMGPKNNGYTSITSKEDFDWPTYKYCQGSSKNRTKYCTNSSNGIVDNKTVLDLEDDAAFVNWGEGWRMPTSEELKELASKCVWAWTTRNGVKGYRVVGPNGESIFLPAGGVRHHKGLYYKPTYGNYWSSNILQDRAIYMDFYDDVLPKFEKYDYVYGRSIRPVCI